MNFKLCFIRDYITRELNCIRAVWRSAPSLKIRKRRVFLWAQVPQLSAWCLAFWVGVGGHRVSTNLQSTAEHQTGDVIRWQGLRAACCGNVVPAEVTGQGSEVTGVRSRQQGPFRLPSWRKKQGDRHTYLCANKRYMKLSEISFYPQPSIGYPCRACSRDSAPLSRSPSLCRSFLVQSDVFITACTPPASQQMLCLYMAVSAQPRRHIPFKRLGGCHSDSRSSSCPTLVAQSLTQLSVRFIYSTLWSVWLGL